MRRVLAGLAGVAVAMTLSGPAWADATPKTTDQSIAVMAHGWHHHDGWHHRDRDDHWRHHRYDWDDYHYRHHYYRDWDDDYYDCGYYRHHYYRDCY